MMNYTNEIDRRKNLEKRIWYEQNCLSEDNIKYINNMLSKTYNLKEIPSGYGYDSVIIEYGLKTYKIEIDEENMCLKLLKRNQVNNPKAKDYFHLVENAGENGCFYEDAWYECILYIARKG